MDRVLFDDCEYSDAQELMYNGEPFTGVVIERGLRGQLLTEQHFRHGGATTASGIPTAGRGAR